MLREVTESGDVGLGLRSTLRSLCPQLKSSFTLDKLDNPPRWYDGKVDGTPLGHREVGE